MAPFLGGAKARIAGGKNQVNIRIRNGGPSKALGALACITPNEYRKVIGRTYTSSECDLTRPGLCKVIMPMDGWGVDLFLDKALYSEPETSCKIVRKFLDVLTLSRDSLLESVDKE